MPKYIPDDYNQSAMVVINYLDQLQPGTFEHAIHYLIDNKLDLSIFHSKYQNEDNGRPVYDPAVLLKIILFAYSKGITSSREPESANHRNGNGRQVSFLMKANAPPNYTDWMTNSSGMNLNSLAGPERGSLTEETNNLG
ncbi:transposase [Rheinheimera baltica]|uniref:Transposase n=1 Tax=Rheinheimera baltica TaxID=67576 RepID=A0ABT9HVP6_9GAMM|nr:transposase [Rheinheimera baltica]MDP5135199.1 transposase [Rheinheimera baltica]